MEIVFSKRGLIYRVCAFIVSFLFWVPFTIFNIVVQRPLDKYNLKLFARNHFQSLQNALYLDELLNIKGFLDFVHSRPPISSSLNPLLICDMVYVNSSGVVTYIVLYRTGLFNYHEQSIRCTPALNSFLKDRMRHQHLGKHIDGDLPSFPDLAYCNFYGTTMFGFKDSSSPEAQFYARLH